MLNAQPTPCRIAVIDDDYVFLELMQDLLGIAEGYDVATCSSWLNCFEFVQQFRPDLIILDLMLGREQAGWAVLERLRSDPTTCETPVILCSAAAPALERHAAKFSATEALASITKPFDVDHLLETITRLLTARRTSLA
jgi:CheY-like chemotaxis protein